MSSLSLLRPLIPSFTPDLMPGVWVMLSLLLGLSLATVLVSSSRREPSGGALQAQVVSWWWLLPPVFVAWVFYPHGVWGLVVVISALAARELSRLANPGLARGLQWRLAGLLLAQAVLCALGLSLWAAGLMLMLAGVLFQQWRLARETRREALLQAIFATQAAGLCCLLAGLPAAAFLYLCVVTALNDIGQFLIGTRFGRHKLAQRISPHKTWQGVGGGLLISSVASVLVGLALGLGSVPWLAAMGLVLSVAGILGDLLFSACKRALEVKDYSRLIPGHGGILDRVDSLVLTAPALLLAWHLT